MKPINFGTIILAVAFCAYAVPTFGDDMSSTNSATTPLLTPADFAWDAAIINLKEIRLGEAAQNNSQNPDVQKFGKHMVRDHTKMFNQLTKIAGAEGLQLPETNTFYITVAPPAEEKEGTELMPETPQQQLLQAQLDVQSMVSLSGPAFDQAYADAMVKGHEKAIQKFEDAASTLQDDQLKKYADKGLRNIRHHLEMAQELQTEVMQSTNSPATASGSSTNSMPGM
jgi:putative membrane protein